MADKIDKLAKETGLAIAGAVASPLAASLRVIGAALGTPDLADTAIATLQDDIVRLHQMIAATVARLDEHARSSLNAFELAEIVMQTHANMGRTASTEKRALMRNIVINGLNSTNSSSTELRLFVQAVSDLDLAHIAVIRGGTQDSRLEVPPGDVGVALTQALVSRGFVREILRAGTAYDSPHNIPIPASYQLTGLGERFVHFLRTAPSGTD